MKHLGTLLCWLRWLAILLSMAGFFAWLISSHLAPRPFASVWWPCLIGSVIASVIFVTFNLIEGGCIGVIFLLLGFIAIGAFSKFHPAAAAGYYYVIPAALLTGFVATRDIFYSRFFS
ncbi:MAG: hypothetical protein WAW39_08320 [Prosthecobacter sp.]|uniref:hypothetical protein n=1 Tax=Prosthecobacter sp. TaxID=1965333 RepID=UPI003BAED2B6